MDALYEAVAHATGDGRNGHARTDDGVLEVDVRVPTELGGPGGATNPEQLFAAGYAACFHSAMKFVAGGLEVDVTDSAVSVTVGLGFKEGGTFELELEIDVEVPNASDEQAQALVER